MSTTRVVVVDGSPQECADVVRALQAGGASAVVGQACDAADAIRVVRELRPDVVTVDLQVPGGGQHVIEQVMASTPTPILVLSGNIAGRESVEAVAALVAGAVEVLPKPRVWGADEEAELRATVRLISGVAVVRHPRARLRARAPTAAPVAGRRTGTPVVAIGASTGGPAALAEILSGLGGLPACVLVVQHLHPDFVGGLVAWMGRASPLPVELAHSDARLRPGVAFIAPGGTHLRIGTDDEIVLDPLPEALHRPSIDVLFRSVAERDNDRNIGVLLTGMGDDGAAGLLALRRHGDVTIAQDEATSVVYGMPRAAERLGGAVHVLPLDRIAPTIKRSL